MTWTQPLQLQDWLMTIFSGTPEIFTAVALFFICGMAGYFRMNGIGMFFMIGVFLLMFSGFINSSLIVLVSIVGGLLIGFLVQKMFTQ